jgi:membrane protein required for colicin V production
MQIDWVDLVIIVIVGLSAVTGLFRGLIKEFIALGIWVLAIWAGYKYSQNLTPWLQHYIHDKSIQTMVAFIIILLGVLISGGIINALLGLILRSTGLGSMDKILGAAFGFARGVFIVALIMAVMNATSMPYQQYVHSSKFYPALSPLVQWISGYFPQIINKVKSADKSGGLIDIAFDP